MELGRGRRAGSAGGWLGDLVPSLAALPCFLVGAPAFAQVALPFDATNVQIDDLVDEQVYTIDLGTLPLRAGMSVEVTPDASHPDLELEIEITQCPDLLEFGNCPSYAISSPSIGANSVSENFDGCSPATPYPGETCDVEIRVLDFGAAGAPAQVDVAIRGYTDVPTGTGFIEYDPIPAQQTVTLGRDRDTTIYEEDPTGSNGQGSSIWAASRFAGAPPFDLTYYRTRGLVSFDVGAGLGSGPIPSTATIDDVEIILHATEIREGFRQNLQIHLEPVTVDPSPFAANLIYSGDAIAPGDQLQPGTSLVQSTTWSHQLFPFDSWSVPGAPTDGIVAAATATLGPMSFQSQALTDAVAAMHATNEDGLGFRLAASGIVPLNYADQGVRFASGEHPTPSLRPMIIVDYTPAVAAPTSGNLTTGAVTFIGEGENFRWIYDEDGDDILLTDIGGRCEETALDEDGGLFSVPYNYSFLGDPAYQGLDCCTWQIESQATGTIGTGQAIFFLNVDSSDPANQPGDFDGDGIRDLCDNCPYLPNGPLLGSCVGGPDALSPCRSNQECSGASFCSLSQEDDDFEFPGQACPVPEPASLPMLLAGLGLLLGLERAHCRERIAARRLGLRDDSPTLRASC